MKEQKKYICDIGKKIYQAGFSVDTDSSISVKRRYGSIYCTPTNVPKNELTPDMIVHMGADGELVSPSNYKPSSELPLHTRIYESRPDVFAVLHAHPPFAAAYAVCHLPLNAKIMAEAVFTLGEVPVVPFEAPESGAPDFIAEAIEKHDAVLLANHGVITVGADLDQALRLMESVEHWARIGLYARLLGGGQALTDAQISTIIEQRRGANLPGKHPFL